MSSQRKQNKFKTILANDNVRIGLIASFPLKVINIIGNK